MRNIIAISALLAATAIASPALAQNAHTYPTQTNNAPQVGTVNINTSTIAPGATLNGSAVAVGNILTVETRVANTNQAITEVNSGNGLGSGPQFNSGNQTSNLTVANVGANGATAALSSTAAGNVTNQTGMLVTQRGNATFSQISSGVQTANLNVTGGSSSTLNATSAAFGNSLSATGGTVLLTPARTNPASNNNYIPTDVIGQVQTNNGSQTANLTIANTALGTTTATGQAVGNAVSINATTTTNVGGHQINNGAQVSNVNFNNVSATGSSTVGSVAVGNTLSAVSPLTTVTGGPDGFNRGDSSLQQTNNATQTANLTVNSNAVQATTATATAVGNSLSFTGTGSLSIGGTGNFQTNNAAQTANLNATGGSFGGVGTFASQAVGNLLPVTVNNMSAGFNQTNNASQTANTNLTGLTLASVGDASALSIGNSASFTAPGGFIGSITQLNNAGQFATTNVTGVNALGNISAGATAVGNAATITVR